MNPREPLNLLGHPDSLEYTLVVLGSGEDAPPGFLLGASRLSVGAGEADDVFLSGVGVAPAHVRLVFLDGEVTLLAATEEVRIDGEPVTAFPVDLKPLQVLSLSADTHLAYGPVNAVWPTPPAWEVPEAATEPEPAALAGAAVSGGAAAGTMPAPRSVKQTVALSARMGGVVVGVAAILAVAVALVDLIWGSREVVNPNDGAIDQSVVALEKLLARHPDRYSGVELHRRSDGAIALRGFMESTQAYQELAEEVRQQVVSSGGNVRLDALTRERLQDLIADQISRFPLASEIDTAQPDLQVRIFGIRTEAMDPAQLMADLERVGARVAPRKMTVSLDLTPVDKVTADITGRLASSPITREFQLAITDVGGRITGVVAPAAEEEARALLFDLLNTYSNRLPLTFALKVDPKLNFTVVGLTLSGESPSATLLQRGRVETYRVGETVFDTGELREIRRGGVMVGLGRRELFVPLARR